MRVWSLRTVIRRLAPTIPVFAIGVAFAVTHHPQRAEIAFGVGALMLCLVAVGVRFDLFAKRLGGWLAAAISAVFSTLFGIGLVVVGFGFRVLRRDVLRGGSSGGVGPGWITVPRGADDARGARRTFAAAPAAAATHGVLLRLLRGVSTVVGAIVIAVGLAYGGYKAFRVVHPATPNNTSILYSSFAFPNAPWVATLHAEGWPTQFDPSLQWKAADASGPYLNVHDGVRKSWESPTHRFVVWFVGGSTMYGLGQRDLHTIASDVARLSAAGGMPIQAVNLGVPGYDQWQEEQLVAQRLSRGEHPDLVVYYDGANDLTAMETRASEGIVPLDEPPNRFQSPIEEQTHYEPETRSGHAASFDQLVAAFDRMYSAGVDLATRTAAAYGVPVAFFWQPEFSTQAPSTHDGPLIRKFPDLAPGKDSYDGKANAAVQRHLPPTVVDLARATDGAPSAVYFDPVHMNELGARMVATAMWPSLRAALEQLPGGAAPG